ncbi:MAG: hypothetical protein K1000chlam2_00882 [Chlamydiae bacterium]|nr:hypothetical protein [Chlamydiota bacterium]
MRGFTIFIIIIVALIVLFFLGWSRIPDMLANNLSKKLGVTVSIDSMDLRPSRIDINQIEIGNIKGYSLPKSFSAKQIEIHAPLTTYLTDHIVIEEVDVEDIYLGLEFDSPTSTDGNWTKIMKNYEQSADLNKEGGKTVLIKKLVFTNIRTELLFKGDGGSIRKLPVIKRIELTNISSEGGFPTDQLMSSILGQMLKEVFTQQNLNNMIKGILFDSPGKAVDKALKPFEGIFNAVPIEENEYSA